MNTEQRVEFMAASDVLTRSRHINIGPMTTTPEIVAQIVKALTEGACVRLGRFALAVHDTSIRVISSDDDYSRGDPKLWAETAKVRQTWSLAEPDIINRLAASFTKAWLSDWSTGPAPVVRID